MARQISDLEPGDKIDLYIHDGEWLGNGRVTRVVIKKTAGYNPEITVEFIPEEE